MASEQSIPTPQLPIPITHIPPYYLIFDADAVSYTRRAYNIAGTLIGSIPQAPSQNVFHGLPAQLMPEEARLLVEKGAAYLVDDVPLHQRLVVGLPEEERKAYARALEKQGTMAAGQAQEASLERKKVGLAREAARRNRKLRESEESAESNETGASNGSAPSTLTPENGEGGEDASTSLFDSASVASKQTKESPPERFYVTPATSYPPLQPPTPPAEPKNLPAVPNSYPLFKLLHNQGYFMFPGLRFGCQYSTYPGDSLRYHSHFLAIGKKWDEEFDLIDLVGGGRLGTGVKKGYLIGGEEPNKNSDEELEGEARAFCVEWAGM